MTMCCTLTLRDIVSFEPCVTAGYNLDVLGEVCSVGEGKHPGWKQVTVLSDKLVYIDLL